MSATSDKRASGGKPLGNQKPPADDLDEAMRKAIGATVQITTTSPSLSYGGVLYTACPVTHLVAINVPSSTQSPQQLSGSFHIIPITSIEKFKIVSLAPEPEVATTKPPVVTPDRIQALKNREEAAIRKQKTKDATRGKGVSKEGQEIFDAIHRTLPTRWHGTTIVVNDAVMIDSPYTVDNCQVEKGKEASLVHVKKIMEHYLARKGNAGVAPQLQHRSVNSMNKSTAAVPSQPLRGG